MKILVYILTLVGAVIGGFSFLGTMVFSESAPQQAAGAAMAIAWAIIPYCFARAIEKITEVPTIEAFQRHWKREDERNSPAIAKTPAVAPVQVPKFHPWPEGNERVTSGR